MDVWDHEGNADHLYSVAGIAPDQPRGPVSLARALGLRVCRSFCPMGVTSYLDLTRKTIYIRRGTPGAEAWRIFHEVAEFALVGEHDEQIERAADALAARLRAPRQALRGLDHEEIADVFGMTALGGVIRWAEATSTPIALVGRGEPRFLGAEWSWPDAKTMRRIARDGADGFVRVSVGQRRTVLMA